MNKDYKKKKVIHIYSKQEPHIIHFFLNINIHTKKNYLQSHNKCKTQTYKHK